MEAQKPDDPKAASAKKTTKKGRMNSLLVIVLCFIVSVLFYMFVLGAPENYENGHPINLMGTIMKVVFVCLYSRSFDSRCCFVSRTFYRSFAKQEVLRVLTNLLRILKLHLKRIIFQRQNLFAQSKVVLW